jgi:hypothetical protein
MEATMRARGRDGGLVGETGDRSLMDAVMALAIASEAIRRGEDAGGDFEIWHDADAIDLEAELSERRGGELDLCVHHGRVHIRPPR